MCFRDTIEDVYTMHKQLGLVHYFLAYKKQPIAFQHIPDEGNKMIKKLTYIIIYNIRIKFVFYYDLIYICDIYLRI